MLVGIATCKLDALAWADETDVALVDVFLLDGPTGPEIGKIVAQHGVSVLFMTGNLEELGDGIFGTLGVISRPILDAEATAAIRTRSIGMRNAAPLRQLVSSNSPSAYRLLAA